MFSIGEYSKITGLTMKTLRFYHERGLLTPARVEAESGYRYYDERNVDTARSIVALRDHGFTLDEIAEILREHSDEADILSYLSKRKQALLDGISRNRELVSNIDRIIEREMEARQTAQRHVFDIETKTLPSMLVAGIRMGRYAQCGTGFAKLGRSLGRHISGKPLCLYYDGEYRDEDADFEPCMPVRRAVEVDGVHVRELPGGRCISLVHRGPYSELGRSYERLITYAKKHDYEMHLPSREVYTKGPGMIFKGSPQKYLTEVQILIEVEPSDA